MTMTMTIQPGQIVLVAPINLYCMTSSFVEKNIVLVIHTFPGYYLSTLKLNKLLQQMHEQIVQEPFFAIPKRGSRFTLISK